ncbi:unnamed protein product, partial [Amoebophrya sp. A25]|eukprot:GSA25T00011956001.1
MPTPTPLHTAASTRVSALGVVHIAASTRVSALLDSSSDSDAGVKARLKETLGTDVWPAAANQLQFSDCFRGTVYYVADVLCERDGEESSNLKSSSIKDSLDEGAGGALKGGSGKNPRPRLPSRSPPRPPYWRPSISDVIDKLRNRPDLWSNVQQHGVHDASCVDVLGGGCRVELHYSSSGSRIDWDQNQYYHLQTGGLLHQTGTAGAEQYYFPAHHDRINHHCPKEHHWTGNETAASPTGGTTSTSPNEDHDPSTSAYAAYLSGTSGVVSNGGDDAAAMYTTAYGDYSHQHHLQAQHAGSVLAAYYGDIANRNITHSSTAAHVDQTRSRAPGPVVASGAAPGGGTSRNSAAKIKTTSGSGNTSGAGPGAGGGGRTTAASEGSRRKSSRNQRQGSALTHSSSASSSGAGSTNPSVVSSPPPGLEFEDFYPTAPADGLQLLHTAGDRHVQNLTSSLADPQVQNLTSSYNAPCYAPAAVLNHSTSSSRAGMPHLHFAAVAPTSTASRAGSSYHEPCTERHIQNHPAG